MCQYSGHDLPAGTAVSGANDVHESIAATLDRMLNDP
jgi:hypothetical protein